MKLIESVVIIGEISSGKSTLARRLSDELQIPKASFGGYLVDYCKENNISEDKRNDLQELGQRLIENDARGFLANVISFAGPDLTRLIFEGVRHEIILREIATMANRTASVYLDATYAQRLSRFLSRDKGMDESKSEDDFLIASKHLVEREVPLLKAQCTYVIKSSDSVEEDFQKLKSYVEKWLMKLL